MKLNHTSHVFITAATLQLMILQMYICYLINFLFYRQLLVQIQLMNGITLYLLL